MSNSDPKKFATWAFEQCELLDIEFRFNHKPIAVFNDEDSDISSIVIENVNNGQQEELTCTNLIIASGPFTTGIYDDLFPEHSLAFENNVQYAVRLTAQIDGIAEAEVPSLYIPAGAIQNPKLEPAISLTGRYRDGTITLSAVRKRSTDKPLAPAHALTAPAGKKSDLPDILEQHINLRDPEAMDVDSGRKRKRRTDSASPPAEARLVDSSASFIGTSGPEDRPIITKVPHHLLYEERIKHASSRRNGVWLCFGFGYYGTYLAPGAAKLMAKIFFRDVENKSLIYNSEYGLDTPVRARD